MAGKRRKRILWGIWGICVVIGITAGVGSAIQGLQEKAIGKTQEIVQQMTQKGVPFSEIVMGESEVSEGYYYQNLSQEEQTVYKEILQGIQEGSDCIYLHSSESDQIGKIYGFLLCDRPELFWCTGELRITSYSDYAEAEPVYSCQGEERLNRQAEIDAAVEQCLSGIGNENSEYERVKYVFEYLVDTVDYDMEAPDNQNIYSALVNRASVCAGYSRAAQYLLQKMGVECIYVTGNIPNQGAHAWNIVKCNGQYYQLDVTFGDPVFLKEESGEKMPESSINYGYLCCTDEEIFKNHEPDADVIYPACTSMDLNYYVLNGMYYDFYDSETILSNMNQAIYNMESSFTCKFSTDELYQMAHDDMIQNLIPQAAQNLASYYRLESVSYMYVEDEDVDKITVFWNYQ